MPSGQSRLTKEERMCSKKLIEVLFKGGQSRSMSAFPLRVVYMLLAEGGTADDGILSEMLVSVPKRCFKRAVKRNHVKRQVREAYRRHKTLVGQPAAIAFVWLDNKLHASEEVERKVVNLLRRVGERIQQEAKV